MLELGCVCSGDVSSKETVVQCSYCAKYFHLRCMLLLAREVKAMKKWCCPSCDGNTEWHNGAPPPNYFSLPAFWRVERKTREKGNSVGLIDLYWISPTGAKFRSKGDIQRQFGLDVAKVKRKAPSVETEQKRKRPRLSILHVLDLPCGQTEIQVPPAHSMFMGPHFPLPSFMFDTPCGHVQMETPLSACSLPLHMETQLPIPDMLNLLSQPQLETKFLSQPYHAPPSHATQHFPFIEWYVPQAFCDKPYHFQQPTPVPPDQNPPNFQFDLYQSPYPYPEQGCSPLLH